MPGQQLNRAQLVQLIRAERPEWASRGIEAAVGRGLERWPAEIVLRAGLAAARDQSARTPAVIPSRCEHEQELMASGARAPLGLSLAARPPGQPLPPEHCGRSSCGCNHRDCEGGWLEQVIDQATGEARVEDGTRPCPTCRPGAAATAAQERAWRASRDRRLAELAASRNDAGRRQLLDDVRAQLAARRAHRNSTTTTTTNHEEGLTA